MPQLLHRIREFVHGTKVISEIRRLHKHTTNIKQNEYMFATQTADPIDSFVVTTSKIESGKRRLKADTMEEWATASGKLFHMLITRLEKGYLVASNTAMLFY